jgi:putative lipoprotein (rSAM/lipoprotein system)
MKRFFEKIMRGFLSLLGFSFATGCMTMYGCPPIHYREYRLQGKVEAENGEKLPGIRVVFSQWDNFSEQDEKLKLFRDTMYTDAEGRYEGVVNNGYVQVTAVVKFEDIDGSQNGGYFKTQIKPSPVEAFEHTQKGDGQLQNGVIDDGIWTATIDATLEKID